MLRSDGYAILVDPDQGQPIEWDTAACGHCERVIFTKPNQAATVYLVQHPITGAFLGEEAGAFCRVCMRPVCLPCHAVGRCVPWERRLDAMEARARLVHSVLAS
jgi:hypothetical protein